MTRVAAALLYAAALAGGTYLAFRPTFDSGFARVQTDTGDAMLNHYLLEHSWRAVADPDYRGGLFAPPFFHPARWVYWYSETLLGAAPVYWGLRLALPFDLAYQWWQIVCSALNFVAFAAVARWFRCGHLSAALGGFLWAFALSHVGQANHQQLIPRFWMPVAAYHAWHLATGPNRRSLNRALGATFLQAVTCVYTGWFLAVGLAVFVPVAAALTPGGWRGLVRFARDNRRRVGRVVGLWGLAFAAYFAPFLVAHWGTSRSYYECLDYLPSASAWFAGPPGSRWHDTLRPVLRPVDPECVLFNGFGLYVLVAAAAAHVWVSRRALRHSPELVLVAACLATAAVWWVLTLNLYEGVSLWWVVRFVPGGQAIRCVSRVWVVVDLFAILAVVVGLTAGPPRVGGGWVRAAVLAAVAAPVVVEQTGSVPQSFDKAEFYPPAAAYAGELRGADAGYVIPRAGPRPEYGQVLGMWAGLMANVPVANGYSGRTPDDYPLGATYYPLEYSDEKLRAWLGGRFRGRVAVVDPDLPGQVRYVQIE